MPERLKEILQKVIDWWNKYTTRQKTIIVGIAVSVVFAIVLVVYFTNRPKYTELTRCETTAEASEVQELLSGAGIKFKASTDGLRFEVEAGQYTTAVWLLGSNGYAAKEYKLSDVLSGGLSTTASDKEKLTTEYYEKVFARDLEQQFTNIKKATVHLHIPPDNGTLIRQKQESGAFITLTLDGTFTSANAANLAKCFATWLGNDTTSNITIVDSDANMLFTGGDDYTSAGVASSLQELQNQGQSMVANKVKSVFYGTNQFNMVEVTCSLDMDFSEYQRAQKIYSVEEGRDQGFWAHSEDFESSSENTGSYVPGTDSNDENVYVSPDSNNSSATQTESLRDYLPNEDLINTSTPPGVINYNNSAMTIALITYRVYNEEDVKRQGLLDGGITWEDFKLANAGDVKKEVDPDYYSMAHTATRIPEDSITIVAYESPIFNDKPAMEVNWTNVLSIVMLVVILALLAFVILRSMASKRETSEEEELSVESLLQSTPGPELEDIDVENKSETRKLIEKFVDENPELAAALLRNWLGEDW